MKNIVFYEKVKEVVSHHHRLHKKAISKKIAAILMATTMLPFTGCMANSEEVKQETTGETYLNTSSLNTTKETKTQTTSEVIRPTTKERKNEQYSSEEITEGIASTYAMELNDSIIYDMTVSEVNLNTTVQTTQNHEKTNKIQTYSNNDFSKETENEIEQYTDNVVEKETKQTSTTNEMSTTKQTSTTVVTTNVPQTTVETTTEQTEEPTTEEIVVDTEPVYTEYTLDMITYDVNAFNYYAEQLKIDLYGAPNIADWISDTNGNLYYTNFIGECSAMLALLNGNQINEDVLVNCLYNETNGNDYIQTLKNGAINILSLYYTQQANNTRIDFSKYTLDKDYAAFLNQINNAGFIASEGYNDELINLADSYFIKNDIMYTFQTCTDGVTDLFIEGTIDQTVGSDELSKYASFASSQLYAYEYIQQNYQNLNGRSK